MKNIGALTAIGVVSFLSLSSALSAPKRIQITVENISPGPVLLNGAYASPTDGGVWVMRPWVGFHDGSFKNFSLGTAASSGVEHEAEDGFVGDLANTTIPPDGAAPYGSGDRDGHDPLGRGRLFARIDARLIRSSLERRGRDDEQFDHVGITVRALIFSLA